MLINSKVVLCHLKKLVRPETFGPYYVLHCFKGDAYARDKESQQTR